MKAAMKTRRRLALALAGAGALAAWGGAAESVPSGVDPRVEYRDCPKCDKRIRIDLAANKAYVNLSRLEGAGKEAVAARAARLLDAAKIPPARDPKLRPLMGWSSWNTFGCEISEDVILETARAMATNGLMAAGYAYVNIDDGFFWGHGEDGRLRFHPERFPNGMKPVVDGIHALGLKAGIYSDAGENTCGSMGGDKGGVGAGLYGHDAADCKLHFNELGFDFIKVDYCGGKRQQLDERRRYAEIADAIKATGRTDVRFNICRWALPGTWAADIAESWRTTHDIRANWKSVRKIVAENLYLGAYAKPGHYNDMDMLEVGQLAGQVKTVFGKHGDTGLTPEEEKTHFGMWCFMSSPLLIGCDVRTIPEPTKALVTNPYLLAVNQNDLGLQAYVVSREGDACILVKDADVKFGTSRYVALYNGSDAEHEFCVRADDLDLGGAIDAFDLVEMADVGRFEGQVFVKVPPHGAKFYRFDAARRVCRRVYEAECAYLSEYQELRDATKAGTAFPGPFADASGGMIVRFLGSRDANDLTWPEVKVDADGVYALAFDYVTYGAREFDVSVDGGAPYRVAAKGADGKIATAKVVLRLSAGVHSVRLSNANGWMPDIDRMVVAPSPLQELPSLALRKPDRILVDGAADSAGRVKLQSCRCPRGEVAVYVTGDEPVSKVELVWDVAFPGYAMVYGGEWERTYANAGWYRLGDRSAPHGGWNPWYFLVNDGSRTDGYGLVVQPNAFGAWKVEPGRVTLSLDVRAGSRPLELKGRPWGLKACSLVKRFGAAGETPFAAAREFCREMCGHHYRMSSVPRLPKGPVYGYNDWNCAYGGNTATNFLADAEFVVSLVKGEPVRPYVVVDDGWQRGKQGSARAKAEERWAGVNERWGMAMDEFARRVKAMDARPGLWYRPFLPDDGLAHEGLPIDPTDPALEKRIRADMARFVKWGFELVKADFITYDWSCRWGGSCGESPVARELPEWRDRSRTTAEVVKGLYAVLREAAGDDMVIIGCNALDHFAAGLFEIQRIGDDTSGYDWGRTRNYGVNTLGMRMIHHGTFYFADGDCVGLANAGAIPWRLNSRWLDLSSRSGAALFVSWKRELATPEIRDALETALRRAARGRPTGEPLDWMERVRPVRWRFGDEVRSYDWE